MKLIIKDIKKSFKDKEVLKGADYEFDAGKITGLLGRNGSGKTTLFSIINGELAKDNGEILIEDQDGIRPVKDEDIGMVYAETILPDFLTGYEFIKFYLDLHAREDSKDADYYLDLMELDDKDRNRLIIGYSSGMKAKLALLCIFIARPKVILLDEPLTSLDVVAGQQIKKMFLSLKDDHIIILSTHMLDLAKDVCSEIAILHGGKLKSMEEVQNREDFDDYIVKVLSEAEGDE